MNTGSRIIIYYITDGARELSERVQKALPQAECVRYTGSVVAKQLDSARAMVFIIKRKCGNVLDLSQLSNNFLHFPILESSYGKRLA